MALQILGVCAALSFSYFSVAALRWWALRANVLDVPNKRSSHARATPRGGGAAIVVLVLIGWTPFTHLFGAFQVNATHGAFLLGGSLIAVVSWLDDLRGLSNRVRFTVHCLSAALLVAFAQPWTEIILPWAGTVSLSWCAWPFTLMWIVGFTNTFNFMDGVDGIAGTQALIGGLAWASLGWRAGQPDIVALGLLIAIGALGFLGHNWPPARIFMGDVGSAFLGFALAALPLLSGAASPWAGIGADPITAGLLVWPFIGDAVFTFVRRWHAGENVFAAHHSHLYQRLVITGLSHQQVTLLYGSLALSGVLFAQAWIAGVQVAVFGVIPLLLALYCLVVSREAKQWR